MAKVQVRREAAGSRKFRMIPVFGIIPQAVLDEVSQNAQARLVPPCQFSTGETERSRDQPAVKSSCTESECRVSWLVPWDSRLDDLRWNKELRQQFLEPRADRAGAIVLFTQQPRGHDDVGINGPERYLQVLGGANSPVLSFAQGIFVANYDRRADLFTKL